MTKLRTVFFQTLQFKVFVTTMPDLGKFTLLARLMMFIIHMFLVVLLVHIWGICMMLLIIMTQYCA